jgi:hypothetical protein
MTPATSVQSGCSARFADDGTGKDITSQQPNAEARAKLNAELNKMLDAPADAKARTTDRKAGR